LELGLDVLLFVGSNDIRGHYFYGRVIMIKRHTFNY